MNRPEYHDIVEVCPCEVQNQITEIVRRSQRAEAAVVDRAVRGGP